MSNEEREVPFVPSNVWGSDYQSFDFFSIFLERNVLNPNHLDLSFTPSEYLEQVLDCEDSDEGKGYLNLLMMLFTEYYQEKATGDHKITLPEGKYDLMAKQFILLCKCETLRREQKLSYVKEEYLFNPNVKTVFHINPTTAVTHLQDEFDIHSVDLQEFK